MKFKHPKNCLKLLTEALKGLLLFLFFFLAFSSSQVFSQSNLPDCNNLPIADRRPQDPNCLITQRSVCSSEHLGSNCTLRPCNNPPSGSDNLGKNCLANCSTIAYPNAPFFQYNCNLPNCSTIDYSNQTQVPRLNCLLPLCSLPIGSSDLPEVTCSLPICPADTTGKVPGQDCSYLPCQRPTLGALDRPGVNCSLPACPKTGFNPAIHKPLINCLLPVCPEPLNGKVVGRDCSLRFCNIPLLPSDNPGNNCALPKCASPLDDSDQPGINCSLQACSYPIADGELPGVSCTLPKCSDISNPEPGQNCLFALPNGKLAPPCQAKYGTLKHGGDCMNITDVPCSSVSSPSPGRNCSQTCSFSEIAAGKAGITCTLPDCANILGNPVPGQNCLFSLNGNLLPTCKDHPGIDLVRRAECLDLVDMPLCIQRTRPGVNNLDGKNCAKICSVSNCPAQDGLIRGVHYCRHNIDCVNFDNSPQEVVGDDRIESGNPFCHQLDAAGIGGNPAPSANCKILPCNLIDTEEFYNEKFLKYPSNKYCTVVGTDGKDLKCYRFTRNQLRYIMVRNENPICRIHDCKPDAGCTLRDDTINITDQGSAYVQDYKFYINGDNDLTNRSLCNSKFCQTPIKISYRCAPENSENPTQRNGLCDLSGEGSVCSQGYCYKTVDCNRPENKGVAECTPASPDNNEIGTNADITNAWFYRPRPMSKALDGSGFLRQMNRANLCYSKDDLEANNWGFEMIAQLPVLSLFIPDAPKVSLGYFHSPFFVPPLTDAGRALPTTYHSPSDDYNVLNNESRSPGYCTGSTVGPDGIVAFGSSSMTNATRSTTVLGLCGNGGLTINRVSDQSGYYRGYVKTKFTDNGATHSITTCLRFKNLFRPYDFTTLSNPVAFPYLLSQNRVLLPTDLYSYSETCGRRECAITCTFGECFLQQCGADVCKTVTVEDTKPHECMATDLLMNGPDPIGNFISSPTISPRAIIGTAAVAGLNSYGLIPDPKLNCMTKVDGTLRIRAVKYGRMICSFIDAKNIPSFNPIFFNGTEKLISLPDVCIAGKVDANGNCVGGANTNDGKSLFGKWRTLFKVPYIENVLNESNQRGYIEASGKFYRERECMMTPLRVSPPRHYNLANEVNSQTLFVPPLYIINARVKKDGPISMGLDGQLLGKTDFHYPEIEVQFGLDRRKMYLLPSQTGHESTPPSNAVATLNSCGSVPNCRAKFTIEVMVRKEYRNDGDFKIPTFCLYRRIKDFNGAYIDPAIVSCTDRNLPEINDGNRKVLVTAPADNTYDHSKLAMRFLADRGSDGVDNNCGGDDVCTNMVELENPDPLSPTCTNDLERYPFCVQRDYCSRLHVECVNNAINLHNAKAAGQPTSSFENIKYQCEKVEVPACAAKKGMGPDGVTPLSESNYYYGWFNEICVVSGFEQKIRPAVASYFINNSTTGKCVIDPNSPYLTDNNSNTNCNQGGKAPGCLCANYVEGMVDPGGRGRVIVPRAETPHEAGLCIDMPILPLCPAINYNLNPNTRDASDPDYLNHSLLTEASDSGAAYCNVSNSGDITDPRCVHISNKYRSENRNPANTSEIFATKGNAEFPMAVPGMNNVEGQCKVFWKPKIADNGKELPPKANCSLVGGVATWSESINQCQRYKCMSVRSPGIDDQGRYQPGFTSFALADPNSYLVDFVTTNPNQTMAKEHGYSNWPTFVKTNDFLQNVTAINCIPGYRPDGSDLNESTAALDDLRNTNIGYYNVVSTYKDSVSFVRALFGIMGPYTGGTLPQRYCNQKGVYIAADRNLCQRIICPAVHPETPNKLANGEWDRTDAKWKIWDKAGGAEYRAGLASRSNSYVEPTSTVEGTCRNDLGFFQISPQRPPKLKCDSLGNWLPVEDGCMTSCRTIDSTLGNDAQHGFATWDQVDVQYSSASGQNCSSKNGSISRCEEVQATGCINNNYKPYPYPPLTDLDGDPVTYNPNASYPPTLPKRRCRYLTGVGGNYWDESTTGCIKRCPGYLQDPREGIGLTTLPTQASPGTKGLQWPETNFGEWTYLYSHPIENQDTAQYGAGRTNGRFIVGRRCGDNGKWEDPVMFCAARKSAIGIEAGLVKGVVPGSNAVYTEQSNMLRSSTSTTAASAAGLVIEYDANPTDTNPDNRALCSLPNFYPQRNTDGSNKPVSRYACVPKAGGKIDEYYYERVDGDPCVQYCPALTVDQDMGGNSVYPGRLIEVTRPDCTPDPSPSGDDCIDSIRVGSPPVVEGTVINLNCKDDHGWTIPSPTTPQSVGTNLAVDSNNAANLGLNVGFCGRENVIVGEAFGVQIRANTDRTNMWPRVTCVRSGSNLAWSGVSNPCSACRNCPTGATVSGNISGTHRMFCFEENDCSGGDICNEGWNTNFDFGNYFASNAINGDTVTSPTFGTREFHCGCVSTDGGWNGCQRVDFQSTMRCSDGIKFVTTNISDVDCGSGGELLTNDSAIPPTQSINPSR